VLRCLQLPYPDEPMLVCCVAYNFPTRINSILVFCIATTFLPGLTHPRVLLCLQLSYTRITPPTGAAFLTTFLLWLISPSWAALLTAFLPWSIPSLCAALLTTFQPELIKSSCAALLTTFLSGLTYPRVCCVAYNFPLPGLILLQVQLFFQVFYSDWSYLRVLRCLQLSYTRINPSKGAAFLSSFLLWLILHSCAAFLTTFLPWSLHPRVQQLS